MKPLSALTQPKLSAVAAPRRLTLGSIATSRRTAPERTLLIGTEKIGKSTFGASSPSPVFIAAEEGINHLDVKAFPEPQTAQDIFDAVAELEEQKHSFQTLVIDTVDWAEPLLAKRLCERNGWESIESPGFGKGQVALTDEWRVLLARLDQLRRSRGMEVILLAHATVKTFANPTGPDYSRYELALSKGASALLKQWCDCILFADFEDVMVDSKGQTVTGVSSKLKVKGISTGRHVIHTQRTAAWDAGNRYGLPPVLPLDYVEFAKARAKGLDIDMDQARVECHSLADQAALGPDAHARIDSIQEPHELLMALNSLRVRAQQ